MVFFFLLLLTNLRTYFSCFGFFFFFFTLFIKISRSLIGYSLLVQFVDVNPQWNCSKMVKIFVICHWKRKNKLCLSVIDDGRILGTKTSSKTVWDEFLVEEMIVMGQLFISTLSMTFPSNVFFSENISLMSHQTKSSRTMINERLTSL